MAALWVWYCRCTADYSIFINHASRAAYGKEEKERNMPQKDRMRKKLNTCMLKILSMPECAQFECLYKTWLETVMFGAPTVRI